MVTGRSDGGGRAVWGPWRDRATATATVWIRAAGHLPEEGSCQGSAQNRQDWERPMCWGPGRPANPGSSPGSPGANAAAAAAKSAAPISAYLPGGGAPHPAAAPGQAGNSGTQASPLLLVTRKPNDHPHGPRRAQPGPWSSSGPVPTVFLEQPHQTEKVSLTCPHSFFLFSFWEGDSYTHPPSTQGH